ncbi:MAG TPA: hypothetical protein VFQ61_08715, partial [Polyangiaceae bacterium]|nr:hypothetical protein [Polyangiaceae bacterium]
VTLHLSRPAAATALRYSVQTLTNVSGYSAGAPTLEAGVIGGSKRVRSEPITSASAGSSTGDSSWGFAGPKQEVSLSLPDVGSDVVIRLTPSSCMGLCPPPQALWIDDLRVE